MLGTILSFLGGPVIAKLLDFIPDPKQRADMEFQLRKAAMDEAAKAEADQRDINKVEAASPSMFVAGWRPAVGWLCVATLAWQWLLCPAAEWIIATSGATVLPLPRLDTTETQLLLYALLGIGGLRSIDKFSGNQTMKVGGP